MRVHHIILSIILLCGCSVNQQKGDKEAILTDLEKMKEEILPNLRDRDSAVWYTVTGVVDTVKYHMLNFEEWPEEAVGKYIEDFWGSRDLHAEGFMDTGSSRIATFHRDTLRVSRFKEYLTKENNSSWDLIYMGDFELLYFRYLNRKYRRLIDTETSDAPYHEYIKEEPVLWNDFYLSFQEVADSIFLGPQDYMLREPDKLKILVEMFEKRFYMVAQTYLVLTDPGVRIEKRGVWVTKGQLEAKVNQVIAELPDAGQKEALRKLHRSWSSWFEYRSRLFNHLRETSSYSQSQVLLNNSLASYYQMILHVSSSRFGKWKRRMKDDPMSPYRQW